VAKFLAMTFWDPAPDQVYCQSIDRERKGMGESHLLRSVKDVGYEERSEELFGGDEWA